MYKETINPSGFFDNEVQLFSTLTTIATSSSSDLIMCIVDLNRSTLSCGHLWYHLVEGCAPDTGLDDCLGKIIITGWVSWLIVCRYKSIKVLIVFGRKSNLTFVHFVQIGPLTNQSFTC